MKPKYFFLIFTVVTSCNTRPSTQLNTADGSGLVANNDYDSNTINFRRFLAKFKPATLPIVIRPLEDQEAYGHLPTIYGVDSIFIRSKYKDTSLDKLYAYRVLPDTLNSFKVIWMEPTEIYIPMLTIFSKSGIKLSEESLTIGQCGTDCCYTCNETIIISPDLSIYAADSIQSCTCDSSGPRENTIKKYVLMKTGNISGEGKIQLSKMTRKDE